MFLAALFIIAKYGSNMSFSRLMDKYTVIHLDNRMVFSAKKK